MLKQIPSAHDPCLQFVLRIPNCYFCCCENTSKITCSSRQGIWNRDFSVWFGQTILPAVNVSWPHKVHIHNVAMFIHQMRCIVFNDLQHFFISYFIIQSQNIFPWRHTLAAGYKGTAHRADQPRRWANPEGQSMSTHEHYIYCTSASSMCSLKRW